MLNFKGFNYTLAVVLCTAAFSLQVSAGGNKFLENITGGVGVDGFYFYKKPALSNQTDFQNSLFLDVTYEKSFKKGLLVIHPFARYDFIDQERTHFDLREAYLLFYRKKWEFSFGLKNYAWGKTLGFSTIDVVNQTDVLEGLVEREKLGQLAMDASYQINSKWQFKTYYTTGFRPQVFPGLKSRQAFLPLEVSNDDIKFESELKEWQPDLSGRLIYYGSKLEATFGYFYGTSRAPFFHFEAPGKLIQEYKIVHQPFVEFQYTYRDIMLKGEVATKLENNKAYFSSVAELEYTFYNMFKKGLDLMLFGAYLYDESMEAKNMPFSDDFLLGTRVDINDVRNTYFSINLVADRFYFDTFLNFELGTRFGSHLKTKVTYRDVFSTRTDDPNTALYMLGRTGNFGVNIQYYF